MGDAFFAVIMQPSAQYAKSFDVRADAHAAHGDTTQFLRDGRVVHQVPSAYVLRIERHPDQRAAADAVAAHRRSTAGGATIHVQETASAAPRRRARGGAATAIPAEGISVRIDER